MKNNTSNNSPEKPHHLFKEEAMLMAKSIQRPGQSKEQTRLIAQGIEKGITLYKKQQAEKMREINKKKKKKDKLTILNQTDQKENSSDRTHSTIYALYTASSVFLVFALSALVAVFYGVDSYFSTPSVAVGLLMATSVLLAGLAMWMFKSANSYRD